MATDPKPRVKAPDKAKKGEMVEVKTLITHQMETGLRKDKEGKPIPRMIINKFVAKFNGKEVFQADLHPSVSANPYLAFFMTAQESGTFDFAWTDDAGKTVTASAKMEVN
jgi:sulfur-oxidizing protein SoxZ